VPVPADQLTAPLSLTLGVRPARGLILVPEIEALPWMRAFEAAIASQMRCWGGGQSIVVPYSDTIADNPLFWALLDRADPDQIRVYTGSVAEMEELDPEWFEAARQAQEAELADLPGEHATFWEDWRKLQLVEYAVPATVRDDVTRRVAPLQLPGWEDWIWANGATEPLEPFTDVTLFRDLPSTVTDVSRANLGDLERLLLTVEVGRLPPAMREALVARGVDVQIEELAGAGPARMMIFRRQPSDDVYPLAVSELGLAWYRSGQFRPLPVPIVAGDDPWDFALFYALRRWRSLAYWVPQSSLDDEAFCRNLISAVETHQALAYGAVVVSASSEELAENARERLTEWQRRMSGARPPRVELQSAVWDNLVPGPVNRLYERNNFDRPQALYLHEGRTPELPTPAPELVATDEVHTLRWFTDAAVDGWGALRDVDLAPAVLVGRGLDRERLRVARDAPSYLSPQAITLAGMSPKSAGLRPQLVPLRLEEQVRRVAARGGWRVTQSDKGVYASESAQLFGGEIELAAALRDPPLRRVTDGFLVGDVDGAPGRLLADRRRYLTYDDFRTLAGVDEAERVLGQLEEAAAVTRGMVLKCERCRAGGFYTPAESDPTFRCRSCRLEQQPTRESWLREIEPVWHYGLDEVLRRFVQHRGHLPLFAAIDLLADPDDPTLVEFAFELEFRRDDAAIEFDIVARRASELWLGEATTRDRLADGGASERERLDLIHRLADELNARHVLLATSQELRETTRTQATTRLRSPWYELHIVEGVALEPEAPEPEDGAPATADSAQER
jgi:diadenosine tetraphosphatase ApaH/serine/threonine PP2A family protein phosphatase